VRTWRTAGIITGSMLVVVASLSLAAPVLANGIGDLYVATSRSVLEVRVDKENIVNTVDVAPVASALAFSPDGRELFVSSRKQEISRIDIESISLAESIQLTHPGAGLAYPKGSQLVVAMPEAMALGFLNTKTGDLAQTDALPGAVDLVAADRRSTTALAAETDGSWLASVDPAVGAVTTAKTSGKVAAIAVDRKGTGWVVTTSPNRLYQYSLADLKVVSQVDLPGSPVAVAPMNDAVVVAGTQELWSVSGTKVSSWATPAQAVTAAAASDDGTVAIVGESTMIEAFGADGTRKARLKLESTLAPTAIAPIPGPSSVAGNGASTASPTPARAGTGMSAANGPKATPLPPTTLAEDVRTVVGSAPIEGAIVVGVLIIVGYAVVLRVVTQGRIPE
jgi:hypothetical protein